MSAAALADRLGLRKRPRSWSGTCPACDYPRAFSIRTGKGGGDRVRAFCAAGCTFDRLSDALARVAGADWTPTAKAPRDGTAGTKRERKQAAASRLWARGTPVSGTPADRYLTGRALPGLAGSVALRFLGDCPHPEGGTLTALLARVVDAAGRGPLRPEKNLPPLPATPGFAPKQTRGSSRSFCERGRHPNADEHTYEARRRKIFWGTSSRSQGRPSVPKGRNGLQCPQCAPASS